MYHSRPHTSPIRPINLPPVLCFDIWEIIAGFSSTSDLVNISRVSHELHEICAWRIWQDVQLRKDVACLHNDSLKGQFRAHLSFMRNTLKRSDLAAKVKTFRWTFPHVQEAVLDHDLKRKSLQNGVKQCALFASLEFVRTLDLSCSCENWQKMPTRDLEGNFFPRAKNIRLAGPLPAILIQSILTGTSKSSLRCLVLDDVPGMEDLLTSSLISRCQGSLKNFTIRLRRLERGRLPGPQDDETPTDHDHHNIINFLQAVKPRIFEFEYVEPYSDLKTFFVSVMCSMDWWFWFWFSEELIPILACGWQGLESLTVLGVRSEITEALDSLVERNVEVVRSRKPTNLVEFSCF